MRGKKAISCCSMLQILQKKGEVTCAFLQNSWSSQGTRWSAEQNELRKTLQSMTANTLLAVRMFVNTLKKIFLLTCIWVFAINSY